VVPLGSRLEIPYWEYPAERVIDVKINFDFFYIEVISKAVPETIFSALKENVKLGRKKALREVAKKPFASFVEKKI
jgi:hypothetical protein